MQSTYYLEYDSATDSEEIISTLRIVGSGTTSTGSDAHAQLYHFNIYFILNTSPPRAVTIDMLPGGSGTGYLVVKSTSSLTDDAPRTLPISYDVALRSTETSIPTVSNVLKHLVERGFDKYRYTAEGAGCCFWCFKVLSSLEDEEVAAEGSGAAFAHWVDEMHGVHPTHVAEPWLEGQFY